MTCREKIPYPTQSLAKAAAQTLKEHRSLDLHPYLCGWCGQWHLNRDSGAGFLPRPDERVAKLMEGRK